MTFLTIDDVSKTFRSRPSMTAAIAARLGLAKPPRTVHAVDHVSLSVGRGETLGLVGESGCGKSTLGRIVSGIHQPTKGLITLGNEPVMDPAPGGRKSTTQVQMVFQDPFSSLNPRRRIGDILLEAPLAHGLTTKNDAAEYARYWLEKVGLDPAYATRYPHQFSGGQRQRVAIARALAMQPDLLVCDEPVASLDVSIQAQIINLFLKLRHELDLTILFISHDIGVVRHISDRIAVMYLGRIVEIGKAGEIYASPQHPYTRALFESVPKFVLTDQANVTFKAISGELPSPLSPPPGCHFSTRCPHVMDICRQQAPPMTPLTATSRAACHLLRPSAV